MNCVYKITCTLNNDLYVGYCKNLKSRKATHITRSKDVNYKNVLYDRIRQLGLENFIFEPILEMPLYNREMLRKLEKHYYKELKPNLNQRSPMRTMKEYQKDNIHKLQLHRLQNREKHNEYSKDRNSKNADIIKNRARLYYHSNKEKINKKLNSKFNCICGSQIKFFSKTKHLQSEQHKIRIRKVFHCIPIKN